MSWLFPLYLAGAAAIVLPILLHLRRRQPKERVVFSSLMFLERSPQLLTRRSKLERLLLLAARCLALVLLAMLFARPFIRGLDKNLGAGEGDAMAILIDTSASMRRGDLWKRALAAVGERVGKSKFGDQIAVLTFDRDTRTIWNFDQDAQAAGVRAGPIQAALSLTLPGWFATDIGQALVEASRSLQALASPEGKTFARKRIILISDLQEGAKLDSLRGFAWPENMEVDVVRLDAPNTDNLGLSLAAAEADDPSLAAMPVRAGEKTEPALRIRIRNARDSKAGSFSLRWEDGRSQDPLDGYLPSGATRVLRPPPRPKNAAGDVLVLSGDAWDFDNRLFVSPPQPRDVKVLFIGDQASADQAASPLYYLTRALQPTASLRPIVETTSKDTATKLRDAHIALAQGTLPDRSTAQALKTWIQQGGLGVYFFSDDSVAGELKELSGAVSLEIVEASGADYAMLGDVNASHPLLKPFADPRLRDFTKIRFWHHRRVSWSENEARKPEVLARFDNGDPALLLWEIGNGRLIVMTSGWHPAESQLALSTKFVPLLFGWLEAAGFAHEEAASLVVGDVLPLPKLSTGARLTIHKPDGEEVNLAAGRSDSLARADMPGFFKLSSQSDSKIVAVNLPSDEGRINPMEIHRLAEAGVKLASESLAPVSLAAAEKQRFDAGEEEARQRMWFWILVLLLAVLAWETWLAGRKPRDTAAPAAV